MTATIFKKSETNERESYTFSENRQDRMSEGLLKLTGSWARGTDELPNETTSTLDNSSTSIRENNSVTVRGHVDHLNALNRAVSRVNTLVDIPAERITGMQKWDGRILEVDEEYFSAELVPYEEVGEAVIADFPRELLPDEPVYAGDVIYVTVRTIADRGGPRRTSAVRLRRLGTWTEAEIAENARLAKHDAAELAKYFD
jgi:hypothetical protein